MEACFERLRQLRKQIAEEEGVPPYAIFHDSVLRQMCQLLPSNLTDLKKIKGMGANKKLEKYGSRFLAMLLEETKKRTQPPKEG